RRPPRPRARPYTTLFRSEGVADYRLLASWDRAIHEALQSNDSQRQSQARAAKQAVTSILNRIRFDAIDPVGALALPNRWEAETRSEEHTSELQSRENLVC